MLVVAIVLKDHVICVAESSPRPLADLAVTGNILAQHVARRIFKSQRQPVVGFGKKIDALVPCHNACVRKVSKPKLRVDHPLRRIEKEDTTTGGGGNSIYAEIR